MSTRELLMHHGLATGKNIMVHNARPDLDMVTIAAQRAQQLSLDVQVIHTDRLGPRELQDTRLWATVLVLAVNERTNTDTLKLITELMQNKSLGGKHAETPLVSVVVVCDHTTEMTTALTLGALAPCITIPVLSITSHIG